MKLSEAMMLGAKTNPLDSSSWHTCLLGVSVKALGGQKNAFNHEAEVRWPWVEHLRTEWPAFDRPYPPVEHGFKTIISHLSSQVQHGNLTLEQVCDWVASVEPQEEAADSGLTVGDSVEAELSRK